jgi:hypothetical protein
LKATTGALLVLVPLALEVAGCRPVEWAELGSGSSREEPRWEGRSETQPSRRTSTEGLRIVARSGREVVRLSPDDVIRIMQRVGFRMTRFSIWGRTCNARCSPGRRGLYGMHGDLLVSNRQVQIQSHSRGPRHDVLMQQFVLGSALGRRGG